MVKLNFIHQKACLINLNHEMYNIKHQFIKSLTKIMFLGSYEMFFFLIVLFLPNSAFRKFSGFHFNGFIKY